MDFLAQHWVEMLLMAGVFSLLLFILRARLKKQAQNRIHKEKTPLTFGGVLLYVLRLLSFGLVSFLVVSFAIMLYLNIVGIRDEMTPAPSQVDIPADLPFEVQEITFLSEDGLQIAGWYVPPQNGALVITLHGYGGNRLGMRWHAEQLVAAGYGVLMYDERASGESEGDHRSYGWEDPQDVSGALTFLNAQKDVDPRQIGILGCSIGGQIALQGAVYYPQIGAVWADGPSSIRASDIPKSNNPIIGLIKISNYMLDWMYEVKLGQDAPAPMLEIIDDIAPRPIMIVGGGVPMPITGSEAEHLKTYVKYAGENAELWVIPEAVHCDGPKYRPDEYSVRMIEFFDTAFNIQWR